MSPRTVLFSLMQTFLSLFINNIFRILCQPQLITQMNTRVLSRNRSESHTAMSLFIENVWSQTGGIYSVVFRLNLTLDSPVYFGIQYSENKHIGTYVFLC